MPCNVIGSISVTLAPELASFALPIPRGYFKFRDGMDIGELPE